MPSANCTFGTSEPSLSDILERVRKGEVQLPDFQRGWVWDDDHIRSLIASVSLSYPIGAVMLLEVDEKIRFKPRPVQGVILPEGTHPKTLVLDGQQRITSLYLALRSPLPVPTRTEKGVEIERFYYLDIAKCMGGNGDREEAVVPLPRTRQVTSDFGRKIELDASTQDREFDLGLIPVNILFDTAKYGAWRRGYQQKFRQAAVKLDLFDAFDAQVYQAFQQYRIPTIDLKKETPKEAVCQVFEKVNTGGVSLTVFELLTATFAADNYNLRQDWDARRERLGKFGPLAEVEATDFLTALTLLSSYNAASNGGPAVSCKRKDVLSLTLEQYKTHADLVAIGMENAARFLAREKIFDTKSLPYQTQLIPLSAICAALGEEFEVDAVRQKLSRWFWCGVFGELYGAANESRYAFDMQEVLAWIQAKGEEPRTIRDSNFAPIRLLSLQSRLSAAYKGLMVRLMQAGSHDFISGDAIDLTMYFDRAVDVHHIFPDKHCRARGYPREKWNSVVNKAPLTARTNRAIGGAAPSVYLSQIERRHRVAPARLDEILSTHLASPDVLRTDRFDDFIKTRAIRLLDLIETATGKKVAGRESAETSRAFGANLVGIGQQNFSSAQNGPAPAASVALGEASPELEESQVSADGRDHSRFQFRGALYGKGRLVLAVVAEYVRRNPSADFPSLVSAFPRRLQGAIGVVARTEQAQEIKERGGIPRHFLRDGERLTLADGEEVAVCSQWGVGNIGAFIEQANALGFAIERSQVDRTASAAGIMTPPPGAPEENRTRRAFLAKLQGRRCLFSADEDACVLAVIGAGQRPRDVAAAKGIQMVPRRDATEAASRRYVSLWRAEHAGRSRTDSTA